MELIFTKKFTKDLKKIKDKKSIERIQKAIGDIKEIVIDYQPTDESNVPPIPNMVKMKGYENFYRIRVGDYRMGVSIEVEFEEN